MSEKRLSNLEESVNKLVKISIENGMQMKSILEGMKEVKDSTQKNNEFKANITTKIALYKQEVNIIEKKLNKHISDDDDKWKDVYEKLNTLSNSLSTKVAMFTGAAAVVMFIINKFL